MPDPLSSIPLTRLDELERKWTAEHSLRLDKSGPDSKATYYAKGVLRAIAELKGTDVP